MTSNYSENAGNTLEALESITGNTYTAPAEVEEKEKKNARNIAAMILFFLAPSVL